MTGLIVCHGSAAVRDHVVGAAMGVPTLAPVRAAATVDELVAAASAQPPALVLLDARLGGPGPIEAMNRLHALGVGPVVVLLAGPGDEVTLDRALALGARGYLAPDLDRAELDAVAAHAVVAVVPQQGANRPADAVPSPRPAGSGAGGLSGREVEVLEGMSRGRSNSQIAADLFLSEDTVKTHARRLFRKLGASDRAQAVAIGMRRGVIR